MMGKVGKIEEVEIEGRIVSYQSHYSLEGTNKAFKVGGVLMVSASIAKLLGQEKGVELINLATNLPVVEWTNDQWLEKADS